MRTFVRSAISKALTKNRIYRLKQTYTKRNNAQVKVRDAARKATTAHTLVQARPRAPLPRIQRLQQLNRLNYQQRRSANLAQKSFELRRKIPSDALPHFSPMVKTYPSTYQSVKNAPVIVRASRVAPEIYDVFDNVENALRSIPGIFGSASRHK